MTGYERFKKLMDEVTDENNKRDMGSVAAHIKEMSSNSKEYDEMLAQEHKTWDRCWSFCFKKAEEYARKNKKNFLSIDGGSPMFLAWVDEYIGKDDKAEIEAEKKAKEASEKKLTEIKAKIDKKAKTDKPTKTTKKKTNVVQMKPKADKKSEVKVEVETEEVSFFDMFEEVSLFDALMED